MKLWPLLLFTAFAACTLKEEKEAAMQDTVHRRVSVAAHPGFADTSLEPVPTAQPAALKAPQGLYQFYLPWKGKTRIEHTVRFRPDHTYEVQERYEGEPDSIVHSTGTWAPSNGFIWLYKEQVVYARYRWKGDTLQYFDPKYKKQYPLSRQQDILDNALWRNKGKEGNKVFAIGNEPFWNVEVSAKDSIRFLLSEWTQPLSMPLEGTRLSGDSTIFTARNDSVTLTLTILPQFCNDGMSDNLYPHKVQLLYNHQVYRGCGVLYSKR